MDYTSTSGRRENYGVISDTEHLAIRTNAFFSQPKNIVLEFSLFHFGLVFESRHYSRKSAFLSSMNTPLKNHFQGVIAAEELLAVQLGKDLNYEYSEQESDLYDPLYYALTRCNRFRRPDWAYYLLFGSLLGYWNGAGITVEQFDRLASLIPESFWSKHATPAQYIFNSFEERGYIFTSLNGSQSLSYLGSGVFDDLLVLPS